MKSCKQGLLAIIAVAFAASAFATQPGNNGGGNGGCGVGQQTNGCGGSTGGAGGAGGQGGAGGSGTGVGVGVGIAAAAAQANAAALAAQQQAQRQGQEQGQTLNSRNTATGGSARSNATGGQSTATGGTASANGVVTVSVEGAKGDVTYAPAQERAPVATAYAAPLTASNGTCMGSSSAGGQGAAFGLSFGSTWTDNNCDIRYDAEALRAAGLPGAAQARLCQKAEIAKAMEAAGTPCPGTKRVSTAPASPTVAESGEKVQYQDPIIRKRLGLPPL